MASRANTSPILVKRQVIPSVTPRCPDRSAAQAGAHIWASLFYFVLMFTYCYAWPYVPQHVCGGWKTASWGWFCLSALHMSSRS